MNATHPIAGGDPLIIGHRGASAVAPENTLAAFRRALDDGADGLEFDVRLARDRVPVIIHDANLRRTAPHEGLVRLFTSRELAGLDVGSWFNRLHPELARAEYTQERVPTLEEVFAATRERARVLYVELKCDAGEPYEALAAEVARRVVSNRMLRQVVVESFELKALLAVERFAPEIRTAALFDRRFPSRTPKVKWMIEKARACGAREIALHHSLAREGAVKGLRDAGLPVTVWTVDDVEWAERAHRLKCSLMTNHPARMRAAFDALTV